MGEIKFGVEPITSNSNEDHQWFVTGTSYNLFIFIAIFNLQKM